MIQHDIQNKIEKEKDRSTNPPFCSLTAKRITRKTLQKGY